MNTAELLERIAFVVFGLTWVPMLWMAILQIRFYRYLRRHHRETWVRLGEPTFFWNMSFRSQSRVTRFWKGEHERLGDPWIVALGLRLRGLTVAFAVGMTCFVGLGVASWILHDESPAREEAAGQEVAPSTTSREQPKLATDGTTPTRAQVNLAAVAVLVALSPVGGLLHRRFCERLRVEHFAIWRSLGAPTPFWGWSYRTQLSTSWFLLSLRYRRLGDPRLARLGDSLNLLMVVVLAVLIGSGILIAGLPP